MRFRQRVTLAHANSDRCFRIGRGERWPPLIFGARHGSSVGALGGRDVRDGPAGWWLVRRIVWSYPLGLSPLLRTVHAAEV